MPTLLADADPTGGRLLAVWAAAALIFVILGRRRPRHLLRLAAVCVLGAAVGGLACAPVTLFPPHAFRFVCLPLVGGGLLLLLSALPVRAALALGSAALTVALVAGVVRLGSRPVYSGGAFTARHYFYDPRMGYRPRPDVVVQGKKQVGSRVLYDVTYEHDDEGRRKLARPPWPDDALLCFGCSFTYGEGVQGDECWPARVAAARPRTGVFNYGFSGWGPAQMLDLLPLTLPERRQAVYYFLDSHVARVDGSWQFLSGWGGSLSRYVLEPTGVRRVGAFSLTQNPAEFLACQTLGGLGLLRLLKLDVPQEPGDDDFELVAEVLKSAQARLGCPLTVVFEPGSRYAAKLIPLLEGVTCVRLAESLRIERLEGDPHPSPAGHRALAEAILQALPEVPQRVRDL